MDQLASSLAKVSAQSIRKTEAGILIEPPPSLAPAKGTIPDETAAAAPPLDPPGVHSRFQGFLAGP